MVFLCDVGLYLFVEFGCPLLGLRDLGGGEFVAEVSDVFLKGFGFFLREFTSGLGEDVPCVGFREILWDSPSVGVGESDGTLGSCVSLHGCLSVPMDCFREVLWDSLSLFVGPCGLVIGFGVGGWLR